MEKQSLYKSIDLFAGIGGIRLGFDRAFNNSIETVFTSEFDPLAVKTYAANFPDSNIFGDITKISEEEIPPFDICLAGFPCQAFSTAGKRRGFNDTRGTLFHEVARICKHHKPRVIFCENVRGLVHHDGGNTFKTILNTFDEIGYKVFWKLLDSKNFGVPQRRPRVYIVAFRKDIAPERFDFPTPLEHTPTVGSILETAPVDARFYITQVRLNGLKRHRERWEALKGGFGYRTITEGSVSPTETASTSWLDRALIRDERTELDEGKNDEHLRHLTPREAARLQGYPDDFIFPVSETRTYTQLGNSVTVPVIEVIARKIRETLI